MAVNLNLAPRVFPSRIADLGFAVDLPQDWIAHELPPDGPEFSDPTKLFPLAVVTAPHAAIVLAFAARPAYDDGTLHDWAWYLLKNNGITPRAVGTGEMGPHPAVLGEGTQPSDLGPLIVKFAFIVEGGRLVNVSLTAPEVFEDLVRQVWDAAMRSFRLTSPKDVAAPRESASIEKAPAASATTPAAPAPEPVAAAEETEEIHASGPSDASSGGAGESTSGTGLASPWIAHALAADASSLDPEHRMNVNLRDRGAGLVPRVLATEDEARRATVGGGAVEALFDVPYGWHVIDDGKRTLVFEPTGRVQISLNLIPTEGRSMEGILDELEAAARADYAAPEFVRLTQGNISALGVRNIADGDQPLEQYHLLCPHRRENLVLRARLTATPETATPACNLAELIMDSVKYELPVKGSQDSTSAPAPEPGKPAWWNEAVALESKDRLDEAEAVILKACPHLGGAYSTAELYARRMRRLKAAGDEAGAMVAFHKASQAIFHFASQATSGGEGAALSAERDEFRRQLVADFGSDPEA